MSEASRHDTRVLAVVLNYNGGQNVEKTILSLLAGTVVPEVLVIDNASTDNSFSRLRERFPELLFLANEKNLGFAAGMNVGLRYGQQKGSDFFWLLNNDATVEKRALEELLQVAPEKKALLSPAILTPTGKAWFYGGHIAYGRMRTEHILVPRNTAPYVTEYLTGCALFFSQDVLENVGFLDETYFLYYEDAAYSRRAARAGYQLLVVPKAQVVHAERSVANPEKAYWLVRSGIRFFREASPWYWKLWQTVFLWLRKAKNLGILFFCPTPVAREVRRAYKDSV